MKFLVLLTLAVLVAAASASKRDSLRPYHFDYQVKDKTSENNYGHKETRDDDGVTRGEYYVLLPDGRTQVVCYTVSGNSGYQATVKYVEGYKHSWE